MSGILKRIIHYNILCNDLGKAGSIKISLWRMDLALNHQYIHSIKSFSCIVRYSMYLSQRAYGLLQQANKAHISPHCFFPHVWIPRHANGGRLRLPSIHLLYFLTMTTFLPVKIIIFRWWCNIQKDFHFLLHSIGNP